MLRQMAGEVKDARHHLAHPADFRVIGIEARLADARFLHLAAPAAPDGARQPRGHILGKAQRLAHLAQRRFGPVMDDRGDDACAVAAIAFIDILHHLLAPLMLEIDVDIGRLGAFFRQEAREKQVVGDRIDRGHPQQIADQ